MQEKRKLKRWHLVYYLRLFDVDNETEVGHVTNINTEGIKVVSPWPLPAGKTFHFRMELPRDNGGTRQVDFRARCLWSRGDPDDPKFHCSGFALLEPRSATNEAIRSLIEALEEE